MAKRSIREFEVPFAVAPIADTWASANGFGLSGVDADGSRHYVRGSGLLTGQMMCTVRQQGSRVRLEAWIHARPIARLGALFLIPSEMSVEPGGLKGALPRKLCREAVDRLLGQLGQPPISIADLGGVAPVAPTLESAAASLPVPAPPAFRAAADRPFGILALSIVAAVNAVICLVVAPQFFDAFNWRASSDEMSWATVDLGFFAGYLALAGASIAVAWRLWNVRRDAWFAAVAVSAAMIAITLVSGLLWGLDGLGVVGIVVHGGVLGYLATPGVRARFDRAPLAFGQPRP